jgi:cyclopropane fatty-acyl-phospholipid synthase-like methyltransferase
VRTFTALLLLATLDAFAQSGADLKLEHDPRSVAMDAATPTTIVEAMLRMANVGPADFVIDLGSGDGRIVISAIKDFGARGGLGVDINEAAVAVARGRAAQAGLADRARFEAQDLFTTDVSDATVVTAYLFPKAMPRLRDKLLAELKPGTRVVSHDFPFPDWSIDRVWHFRTSEKVTAVGHGEAVLYLYTVPDRK